jgi:hypothetical protein
MKAAFAILLITSTPCAFAMACVSGFANASAKYEAEIRKAQSLQSSADIATPVGVIAAVGCAAASRTPAGYVACGILGVGISGSAYAASEAFEYKIARLENANLLFAIYLGDDDELMRELAVDIRDEDRAREIFKTLMEDGTMCAGGRYPALNYEEVLDLVRERL